MDPFSYAQKAIAVNEFQSERWQAVHTPAGAPLGLTILEERGLPHEHFWIWCACCIEHSDAHGTVGVLMRREAISEVCALRLIIVC